MTNARAGDIGATPQPVGVVYTPPKLAAFVVDRLLDGVEDLPGCRWLEPCCGDGVFLVEAVRRLAKDVEPEHLAAIVERQLVGVDLDEAAAERARAAVREAMAQLGIEVSRDYFSKNVLVRDFLSLTPDELGRFDLIGGNPPYVSATAIDPARKDAYSRRFASAWGRLDLYALFFEQALRLTSRNGRVGFITPDKFLTSQSSRPLRALVARGFRVRSIDRFDRHDLFPGVATVPCVTVVAAERQERTAPVRWWHAEPCCEPQPNSEAVDVPISPDGGPWHPERKVWKPGTVRLSSLVTRISAGWATGLNTCFVLAREKAAGLEAELLRPAVRGRDVQKDQVEASGLVLLLPYEFDRTGGGPRLVDLDAYPAASEYLQAFRGQLERRHCVRVWKKRWYDLHDPVVCDLSVAPKILLPDIAFEPRFAYTEERLVPLHSAYYLLPRQDSPVEPLTLTALLNSKALAAELRRRTPIAKSQYRRFRAQFLRDLPIPISAELDQLALFADGSEAADELITWALLRDAA